MPAPAGEPAAGVGGRRSRAVNAPLRCHVILDGRFTTTDGEPSSYNMHYDGFFKRYLDVFDEVVVVGRLSDEHSPASRPVTGPGVRFVALPNFSSESQFVAALPRIVMTLWRLARPGHAYVLRSPGVAVALFAAIATLKRVPFAVEVMADPYDDFAPGSTTHPLRVLYRELYVRPLQFICKRAAVAAYVTEQALQRRYPKRSSAAEFVYTNLNLHDDALVAQPRPPHAFGDGALHIVNVAIMQRLIKGQDLLVEALRICRARGLNLRLTLVGDGNHREWIENYARDKGVAEQVRFSGLLASGIEVREQLDQADMFVLPSRQEGLPRAMIEAMARGLPCIGADVGGVSELLDPAFVVPSHSAEAIAEKILEVAGDPARLAAQSARNLGTARKYRYAQVRGRRIECYRAYRTIVESS